MSTEETKLIDITGGKVLYDDLRERIDKVPEQIPSVPDMSIHFPGNGYKLNMRNSVNSTEHASAEGYLTTASGSCAHAEGQNTTASGIYSHAEGFSTSASDMSSHAEGESTRATNQHSHAEGVDSLASGPHSHAEGNGTTASGYQSHAEGEDTTASGQSSHAEGARATASRAYAHAEGANTVASNISSHAEGTTTESSGYSSHSEGQRTVASGDQSHAEGSDTTASATNAHAEGSGTTASGAEAHAEGEDTTASGNESHAEGFATTASGASSHAEGSATTASGSASHAEGANTTASGSESHSEGDHTEAYGYYSHAEGEYTFANGRDQHVFGAFNVLDGTPENNKRFAKGDYVEIVGNGANANSRSNARTLDWQGNEWLAGKVSVGTVVSPTPVTNANDLTTKKYVDDAVAGIPDMSAHFPGTNFRVDTTNNDFGTAQYASAEGNGTKATRDRSHAEGGNTTASGFASHAEGGSTVASGGESHAEGAATIASGECSHAEGSGTTASGNQSHAEGNGTIAKGLNSHAEGTSTRANSMTSHAEGTNTLAYGKSQHVFGEFNVQDGDANTESTRATYVEIVGNGTADNARSNARTLDWSGNETLAGDLTVNKGAASEMTVGAEISSLKSAITPYHEDEMVATRAYISGDVLMVGSTLYKTKSGISSGATLSGSNIEEITLREYLSGTGAALGAYAHGEGEGSRAVGQGSHAEGYMTVVPSTSKYGHSEGMQTAILNGNAAHVEGYKSQANGVGAHAEGSETFAAGAAHSEGYKTEASATYSHAEGNETKATKPQAHAEGKGTTASGTTSHAEGENTIASGDVSHAEGYGSTASGIGSHAEGTQATASGVGAHAEGTTTTASGSYSHAEGEETIANHRNQHVFGTLNVADPSSAIADDPGTYVEIVGNGTANNARSNARTLDWHGNEWLAGKVSVGTVVSPTPVTNANDLTTKAYVDNAVAGVTVPVQDVQVNGTSVVSSGVANVPIASTTEPGVAKVNLNNGTQIINGVLTTASANSGHIKAGNSGYLMLNANLQHEAAFYGLAKAASADMKDIASTTVGQYPEAQKSAISEMLNGSVSVSGTTPTINALPGVRYVCGEVTTLDIVTPATGIVDVVFTSGSTPTVLTVTPPSGMAMKWANGFDPSALETETTYEINIMDGCLGVSGSWS